MKPIVPAAGEFSPLSNDIGLPARASAEITPALNQLLADLFALYVRTKGFHWHMTGPHFRDHHLLLDEQATQVLETVDLVAERVRKIGGRTLRSIEQIARLGRQTGDAPEPATARDMLLALRADNGRLLVSLRMIHAICDEQEDIATASLIENWVDEAEQRAWFLAESTNAG